QDKKLREQEYAIHGLTDRLEELVNRPVEQTKDEPVSVKKTEQVLQEEQKQIEEQKEAPKQTIIAPYFSYSILSPIDIAGEEPVIIKGHFVIENKGDASLHEL
ncbi:hypothetical protein, partial [Bacillus sp. JCM 19041]|uniref:hypothetical protein n=1 Tax=Bacillus sp. JCM 19041 TaxID=1460637 RepID=UPI000AC37F11